LIRAINKVAQGVKYISSMLAEKTAFYLENGYEKAHHELLSNSEYQIMLMIALGETVMEISKEHALSIKTISTNRSRALIKMGMKSNAEMTYYAIKNPHLH